MASRKSARLAEIARYVQANGLDSIGEAQFQELRVRLAPMGEPELRRLLRDTGLALAPVVEGVRQEDFDRLERTLAALADEYESASGDRYRARELRRLVITAKQHARFAARSAKDEVRQRLKEEMAEWMLVWLESPGIFRTWVKARRKAGLPGASGST